MNKTRDQFILYAMLAVFVLFTVILSIINGINFTMAAEDADRITEHIQENQGFLKPFREQNPAGGAMGQNNASQTAPPVPQGMGPMGPDSPEMANSMRYVTVALSEGAGETSASIINYQLSAVSEEEAIAWAKSLSKATTGWTRGTYRYRVYSEQGLTYVTIIDQGREMLPCYRILLISLAGLAAALLISFFFLRYVGKRLFKPLEEADRKQKAFIKEAEDAFKLPLTIVSANTEALEKSGASVENTSSIRRQVRKMSEILKRLDQMVIFAETTELGEVDLSHLLEELILKEGPSFDEHRIALTADIQPGVTLRANEAQLRSAFAEILVNARKFSVSKVMISLKKEKDRILFTSSNDSTLSSGDEAVCSVNQVFDRFVTLENAPEAEDGTKHGLGLSYVKETVLAHQGRVKASIEGNTFHLEVLL